MTLGVGTDKMSSSSSASGNNNNGNTRDSRHSGAARRRRRAAATGGASRSHGVGPRGTMALVLLLAVVLLMVVVYLVRRLSSVERTVKRTLGEVRHQVTPDDLHTAFGQWVEANPAQVTAACAPYIDRSVAVAADVVRTRVVTAVRAQAGIAPPPPAQRFEHAHGSGAQQPTAHHQPPPPHHGGGHLGQRADPRQQQQQHHQGHQQPFSQGHQPPRHDQRYNRQYTHNEGAAPFQPQEPRPGQHHANPSLQMHGHHAQQQQQQHAQAHCEQPQLPATPVFVAPPSRSPGHVQGTLPSGASGAPTANSPSPRQSPQGHGQLHVSPRGDDAVYHAPDDPATTSAFSTSRPNIRCDGDVCVVIEDARLQSAVGPGIVHRQWARTAPALSPTAASNVYTSSPGGTPRPSQVHTPDDSDKVASHVGVRHQQQQQPMTSTPLGSRHTTPLGSPAPDPRSTLSRDSVGHALGDHESDDRADNGDYKDGVDDGGGDSDDDDGDGANDDDVDVVDAGGRFTDMVENIGKDDAARDDGFGISTALMHRGASYSAAIAVDDPWSLPDESRFFMGRGDESDDDEDDGSEDGEEEGERDDGDFGDGCGDGAYDDRDADQDDRYQGDGNSGSGAWHARPIISAPVFLVLRASDNGIAAPSGGARIVPLDDDDDDGANTIDNVARSSDSKGADADNGAIHAIDDDADKTALDDATNDNTDADVRGPDTDVTAHDAPDAPREVNSSPKGQAMEEIAALDRASCMPVRDQGATEILDETHGPADDPAGKEEEEAVGTETDKDEPTDTATDSASSDGDEAAPLEEGEENTTSDSEADE